MTVLTAVSIQLIILITCNSQWISVNDMPLPRADEMMACAAYGDSIFIMGGRLKINQFVEYKISSNTMIDHGAEVLPETVFNWGIYYIQWQNILYINSVDINIQVYDLTSSNFPYDVSTVAINTDIVSYGTGECTTASSNFVFILGGYKHSTLNILTLSDNTWSIGPSMKEARTDFPCIVVSEYLYAIGGEVVVIMNERININTMDSWQDIGSLTSAARLSGVVSYDGIIWVVGGLIYETLLDTVWNIDTNDGSVTLLNERLPYAVSSGATVIVHDVLYVFGGRTDADVSTANWMKYKLKETETVLPTTNPTKTTNQIIDIVLETVLPTTNPTKTTNQITDIVFVNDSHRETTDNGISSTLNAYDHSGSVSEKEPEYTFIITAIFISVIVICSLFIWKMLFDIKTRKRAQSEEEEIKGNMVENASNIANVVIADDDDDDDDASKHIDDDEVKRWLTDIVGLPQYSANFVDNGYDRLKFIMCISHKSELKDIGISLRGHQTHIFRSIQRLQKGNNDKDLKAKSKLNNIDDDIKGDDEITRDEPKYKYKPHEDDLMLVEFWLKSDVKLPGYYDNFVQNGYQRLDIIKEIRTVLELQEIGITEKVHCIGILKAVERLNVTKQYDHPKDKQKRATIHDMWLPSKK